MTASAWLSLATIGGLTTDGLTESLRWRQIRYVGDVVIPPTWLLFALACAGFDRFSDRRLRVAPGVVAGERRRRGGGRSCLDRSDRGDRELGTGRRWGADGHDHSERLTTRPPVRRV
ncbi:histidine kinase N-terminal 7TM domain-containing protein [Halobaculum halobium]|uniref:Histidine kinase N-terminal 7TM domain-containing protein n=1 Tax=Halobaculum halobium TaxID=3032281 RepID=A0ABD5T9C1_9EURY